MQRGLLDSASLQRMLYDTLDQSDDIVIVLEQTGHDADSVVIATANGAFCRAARHSPDELIGRPFASLAATEGDPARCAEIVRAVMENRSIHSELLCARQSGPPFWLGLHLMPVSESSPPCFVVLGRDITDALHARQQQTAIQGLLAKVFLSVRAPVAITSDAGLIQMTNPALDELLGYPSGGLVGKQGLDCYAPGFREAAMTARGRQLEAGKDYSQATRLLRADGSEVSAEVTSTIVQRDDLRRFRIVTILPRPDEPAVTVHVAGRIKLVGLDEVKDALGSRIDRILARWAHRKFKSLRRHRRRTQQWVARIARRWAAVAERAMASAEHVVRRRCRPHDIWSRSSDGGFLICFADATEEEAAFRAAAMAREIRTRLIGDGETEATATVSAIAAEVDVPHQPGRTADMLTTAVSERLNSRLAQIEARARETLREALGTTTSRLEPVRSRRTREVVAHFVRLPLQMEQRLLAAYATLPASERQGFDFDRLVLGDAAEQAIAEIAGGGSLLIMVNVDFDLFLDRRRTERYVAACQALDNRLRERLMLILSGMPRGCPKSRILECVMRLRPFCHGVGFQSDGMEAPPVELSVLGAAIIVLQQDRRAPGDPGRLSKLIDSLHAYQARVLVRHVASWEDAKPLARMGVDLVSMVGDERDTAD